MIYDSIDLTGTKSLYLKCIYEDVYRPAINPITEIGFYQIRNYGGNRRILIKPESDIIEPIPIGIYPSSATLRVEHVTAGKAQTNIIVYRGDYDLSELLNNECMRDSCLVIFKL